MDRVAKLFDAVKALNLDAIVLHKPEDIFYFSGYRGEGVVLLHADQRAIITDFRYTEQAAAEAKGFAVLETTNSRSSSLVLAEQLAALNIARVGFDDTALTVSAYQAMLKASSKVDFTSIGSACYQVRIVKDEGEKVTMRRAAQLTDETLKYILTVIKPGMTEKQVALEMLYHIRKLGAEGESFSFIVASGPNASMPHAIPTDRVIQNGDILTMDFGCKVDGYCSDMTRTVAIGQVADEIKKIYDIVLQAQLAGLAAVKPGVTGVAVDKIARDIITQAGYGQYFGHGLGHGVGVEIHEQPRLSPMAGDTLLAPGMVVTVEPGIYLPGLGGVRIEDTVIVTEDGCENLFTASKALTVL